MKTVDLHCDTLTEIGKKKKEGENISLSRNNLHIDLEKMKKGDWLIQNFAIFIHLGRTTNPFLSCLETMDIFYQEMEDNRDIISPVFSYQDIEENRKAGKISALLTVEEGAVCMGEPFLLRTLYRLGVRMMTLTWNFENCLAYPNRKAEGAKTGWVPEREKGLKEAGILIIEEMERLGMIPDISHLSDKGIWDVFAHTKKPFCASHSNARAMASHPRNLTDEMIKRLSERGGIIGVNFYSAFLNDWAKDEEPVSRISHIIRHIKYMKKVGGIQCIGLGSDFDGIDGRMEMDGADKLPLLEHEMRKEGFSQDEIEAVFYKNALRFYKDTL